MAGRIDYRALAKHGLRGVFFWPYAALTLLQKEFPVSVSVRCQFCGKSFLATYVDRAKFCGAPCRLSAWKRKLQQEAKAPLEREILELADHLRRIATEKDEHGTTVEP